MQNNSSPQLFLGNSKINISKLFAHARDARPKKNLTSRAATENTAISLEE